MGGGGGPRKQPGTVFYPLSCLSLDLISQLASTYYLCVASANVKRSALSLYNDYGERENVVSPKRIRSSGSLLL